MIDLLAISAIDRDTEISWIRKERDWTERAQAQGRFLDPGRMLPMLPPNVSGNGHAQGNGHHPQNGHGQPAALGLGGPVDVSDQPGRNPPLAG